MNQQKIKHMNRIQKIRRMFLYALLFLFCCLLENTWYAVGVPPLLCAALMAGIGMCEGPEAALFGVFAGLVYDAAGGAVLYLSPVTFMLYVLICGAVTVHYVSVRFWLFAGFSWMACFLQGLLQYCGMIAGTAAVFPPAAEVLPVFGRLALDALLSMIVSLLLYLPLRLIGGIGKRRTVRRR